jgi:predicted DNA-binding transcriptional regulator YafY
MSYEVQTVRADRLIRLIESSKTLTADELARTLCFTLRTTIKDIEYLKEKGYPIICSPSDKSYHFEKRQDNLLFY